MDRIISRKLDMAERARDFCRAHPSTAKNYADTLDKLEKGLARAKALTDQELSGHNAVRVTAGTQADLRRTLIESPLKDIVRIARKAVAKPEMGRLFRLPRRNVAREDFLSAARVIASDAVEYKEFFVANGMAESFLEELNAALDQYQQALEQQHEGRVAHVGARKDLKTVTAEVLALVGQLDGMNRYRFRKDSELLAGWESATNVAWPERKPAKETKAA